VLRNAEMPIPKIHRFSGVCISLHEFLGILFQELLRSFRIVQEGFRKNIKRFKNFQEFWKNIKGIGLSGNSGISQEFFEFLKNFWNF
jgi:hypothetical protein